MALTVESMREKLATAMIDATNVNLENLEVDPLTEEGEENIRSLANGIADGMFLILTEDATTESGEAIV